MSPGRLEFLGAGASPFQLFTKAPFIGIEENWETSFVLPIRPVTELIPKKRWGGAGGEVFKLSFRHHP